MVSERTAISCPPGIRGLTGAPGDQYYDRGDPAAWDFTEAVLTMNGTWQDLDLSGIIGVGVKIVHLRLAIKHTASNAIFQLRENGNVNAYNVIYRVTQVANIWVDTEAVVVCDAAGKIEYNASLAFSNINILVRGWWA